MSKSGGPTKPGSDERALARLEQALKEALARNEAAEALIEDQRQRLKALGSGREETMRALVETRDELQRISRERDELRKQLTRIDSMQTATIALPEDDPAPSPATADLPSLEDLMTALGNIQEPREPEEPRGPHIAGHLHQRVQSAHDLDESQEMISPAVVFPEEFAATAESAEHEAPVPRLLVLLDPERPVKYPLFKETMTIGRGDVADIQIKNDFLSRVHARVVSTSNGVEIEDVDSKNGIRVNTKVVTRHALRHGDVVDLGRLRFRYIDTAADAADAD